MNARNIFILILIIVAAGLRIFGILPHNFSPVAAIALFGGAMLSNRALAFVAPLAIMFISDLFIGFHDFMIPVYIGFMLIVLIGQVVRRKPNLLTGLAGALAGSVLFFLITNGAVWFGSPHYAQDLTGLLNSYALGLPFFRATLLGDLIFAGAFFSIYELAKLRFPILAKV
ncbi:MAG: hypothetical protein QF371_04915 [Flavobacteriales bacterium]|jgi:prepilin signal peptidase PulO-like enzyme (type II secretory pathway)|nr:hypothetical protein [Flavobacteriales bacterium]